jgi:hypothetical protein
MSRSALLTLGVVALLAFAAAPAPAVLGIGVGIYGGRAAPWDDGDPSASLWGFKARLATPLPLIALEGYRSTFDQDDVEFDGFGLDVLVGRVGRDTSLKYYGVAGLNWIESPGPAGSSDRSLGWELGAGVEVVPPVVSLGIEARGNLLYVGASGDKLWTGTLGLNYHF